MSLTLSVAELDAILAIQVAVGWAGEGRTDPPRLRWWDTDLVDEAGGGDLFARLLPKTHAWASLEAVREAARRVDARTRAKSAAPDRMRSIYFLGFEVDEQLGDRLADLKRGGEPPSKVFPLPLDTKSSFSRERFETAFGDPSVAFTVTPSGRQLKGTRPDRPDVLVRRLAAALVPVADEYPLPFYAVEG